MTEEQIVNVNSELMEKKIVFVADAQIKEADIYRLAEGITYDVMGRTIWRGSESVRLAPQAATLFLQFLHAKEHFITSEVINHRLWNGNGNKNGIHAAVKRLRGKLRETDLPFEIVNHGECYLLKSVAKQQDRGGW